MQIEEKGEVLGTGQWLSPTRKSPCKQTAPKDFTGTVWPKQVSQISSQKANQTKHTFLSQCLPSTSHSVCYHQHLHSSLTQLPAHKMRFVEIPQEKCLELEKISQKEKKKKTGMRSSMASLTVYVTSQGSHRNTVPISPRTSSTL